MFDHVDVSARLHNSRFPNCCHSENSTIRLTPATGVDKKFRAGKQNTRLLSLNRRAGIFLRFAEVLAVIRDVRRWIKVETSRPCSLLPRIDPLYLSSMLKIQETFENVRSSCQIRDFWTLYLCSTHTCSCTYLFLNDMEEYIFF